MSEQAVVQTTVEQVEADISDIFQLSGQKQEPKQTDIVNSGKPSIFSRDELGLSFLENSDIKQPESKEKDNPESNSGKEKKADTSSQNDEQLSVDQLLDNALSAETDQKTESASSAGGTNQFTTSLRKMIDNGLLIPFDDDKPLDQYTSKDIEELLQANFQERDKKTYEQINQSYFQSLPHELQLAIRYVQDGGQDVKDLFRTLSETQQTRELDPTKEEDQETIYRQYLVSIGFGNSEEIEEEISTWKDLGQLDKKAKQAKPKLDKLYEQRVAEQLQQQESLREQKEAATKAYIENVYHALEPGQLGNLKLDKKTQQFLYNSLIQPQYTSLSGKPTNLLGHLLERYQYSEPNYPLIAEALWLLSDPEGYRTKLLQAGANQESLKTVRTLKTEEGRKQVSGQHKAEPDITASKTPKLSRPANIFQR